jgi:ketosteroid isomerase-like protein
MQSTNLEATEETKAQVRATIETYAALRKAGDVEGLVDLFTVRGSVMAPGHPTSTGSEELRAAYEPFRTALGLECRYEFDEILSDGQMASARTRSTGTVLRRATGETSGASWRELFVLHRVDGRWKIAQYTFQSTGS